MMRALRAILFLIPLLLLVLSQSGCLIAAAAAGTGAGMAYVKGKTTDVLDASPRAVADATEMAMKDLDVAHISTNRADSECTIIGRTGKDAEVHVTARAQTDRTTQVFIRVGVFGDEVLQARIIERIRANLGLPEVKPENRPT
jgi:hypothetical protein